MSQQGPGWHNDPLGRHQYRFWDGVRWTDRVADNGVTGSDPLNAPPPDRTPPTPVPTPGGAPGPAAWGAPPGGAAMGPPPAKGKNTKLIAIGVVVVVAAAVAVAIFVLRGDGNRSGPGTFAVKVANDAPAAHSFSVRPGDAFCVAVRGDDAHDVRLAIGIDAAGIEALDDEDYLNSDHNFGTYQARSFYSDLYTEFSDAIDTDRPVNSFPGFEGAILWRGFDGQSCGAMPTKATLTALLLSDRSRSDVQLVIQVKHNPKVNGALSSDEFENVSSDDFYSGFQGDFTDEYLASDTSS